jgi:HAD superfamily hydrolase (TIGR01509 family)
MIRNIVFDFGGVLVKYDFPAYFTTVLGSRERADYFMSHILTDENNDQLDKGDRSFAEFMADWKRRWPDYTDALEAFDHHYTDIFTGEVDGMYDLMMQLKEEGYRLLGLSNWSTKVFDIMKKFPRIFSLLDGYLVSHQVHLLKPQPEIYTAFCSKFGVKAADCVFIDDKPANIAGAKSIGMEGIVFSDIRQLRMDLKALLDRNK